MNPFTDFINTLLDGVFGQIGAVRAFLRNPWPVTLVAYVKSLAAGTVSMFPALALFLSGQTTLQQEPLHKPDEGQAVQAQASTIVQEGNVFEAVAGSGPLSINVSDTVNVSDEEAAEIRTFQPKSD
jgi:hypothetical protein